MQTLYHFFRLIRPLNLLVIALTMGVFHKFLMDHSHGYLNPNPDAFNFDIESNRLFIWIIISTILVAAAGNIINDYFDVKADRINKPEKVVVGKHIKRRWAIILNWTFNSIAFFLAAYVSWEMRNIWLIIIPFASINLLWFYSMYYKRRLLTGNLIIALLTGIVPVHVLIFHNSEYEGLIWLVLIFSFYAFGINLIREIVKDIADIKGDLRLGSKTLPISFGIRKSKIVVMILFIIAIIPLGYACYKGAEFLIINDSYNTEDLYSISLFWAAFISIVTSMVIFIKFNSRKKYLLSSNLLKLAMLFGLLCPLFL